MLNPLTHESGQPVTASLTACQLGVATAQTLALGFVASQLFSSLRNHAVVIAASGVPVNFLSWRILSNLNWEQGVRELLENIEEQERANARRAASPIAHLNLDLPQAPLIPDSLKSTIKTAAAIVAATTFTRLVTMHAVSDGLSFGLLVRYIIAKHIVAGIAVRGVAMPVIAGITGVNLLWWQGGGGLWYGAGLYEWTSRPAAGKEHADVEINRQAIKDAADDEVLRDVKTDIIKSWKRFVTFGKFKETQLGLQEFLKDDLGLNPPALPNEAEESLTFAQSVELQVRKNNARLAMSMGLSKKRMERIFWRELTVEKLIEAYSEGGDDDDSAVKTDLVGLGYLVRR